MKVNTEELLTYLILIVQETDNSEDETESWVVWHSGFCSTSGNNNRIFLDIGSGCGKLIIEIASELEIPCTGIEIDINRFNNVEECKNCTINNLCIQKACKNNIDMKEKWQKHKLPSVCYPPVSSN